MNTLNKLSNPRLVAVVAFLLLTGVAAAAYVLLRRPAESRDGGQAAARTPVLGEVPESADPLAAADKNGDGIVYQDGMHPWIVRDAPGKAPDCGMELTPVRVGGAAQEAGVVSIDPVTIQNIGVRTAPVVVEPLGRAVRTTGRFEANQQLQTAVSPKVAGWVERLHVDYEGARVRRGQPLLEIYSPELVSTQEEYLLAVRNLRRVVGTPAEEGARRLVEAARRRLSYWDVSAGQIERLAQTGQPQKTLTLFAPASGTVVEKDVVQGQQVTPGMTLMQLADLSRIWLMVDVQEQDLSWVRVGTLSKVEMPYEPGGEFGGRVDYVYDEVNPETRTAQARVTLSNPGLRFKPGMFATVNLTGGESGAAPVVPEEAVLRTGERSVVILALGGGRFRPVEVKTGIQADGRVQVLEGLVGGETVVTSAQFLIDSEARLKGAVGAMMSGMDMGAAQHASAPEQPHQAQADAAQGDHSSAGSAPAKSTNAQVVRIAVTEKGFEPQRFTLKAGVPARLVFTRTTDDTCAKQVQVPAFGVKVTDLPLGKPVTLGVTPSKTGSFTFACGMDMVKGTLVVTS